MRQAPLTQAAYYILLAFSQPQTAADALKRVTELSGGRVKPGLSTMRQTLEQMIGKRWIKQVPDCEKTRYERTDKGLKALQAEMERLRTLILDGTRALEEEKA